MLDSGEDLPMHNNLVPLFHLDRMFNISDRGREHADEVVVVVEDGGKQFIQVADLLINAVICLGPDGDNGKFSFDNFPDFICN